MKRRNFFGTLSGLFIAPFINQFVEKKPVIVLDYTDITSDILGTKFRRILVTDHNIEKSLIKKATMNENGTLNVEFINVIKEKDATDLVNYTDKTKISELSCVCSKVEEIHTNIGNILKFKIKSNSWAVQQYNGCGDMIGIYNQYDFRKIQA